MILQSILVVAGIAIGAVSSAPSVIDSAVASPTLVSQCEDIKGKIYDVIHSDDGYVYFLLGSISMAMKASDFPNPTPAEGTEMTATGCTPDPSGWGWICTGLS
jgi:hypothetical protein